MKKRWKYDRFFDLVTIVLFILLFSSCKENKTKHFGGGSKQNLEGLVLQTNQTVFSDIKTILPIKKEVVPTINATGVISYDPRLINNISARFSGRIEKLYLRFNFQSVAKGQRIMDIYSPEILTEQQNLIFLVKNSPANTQLINSARQKLQLLGLTKEQINSIESNLKIINPLPIYSQYEGHIHDIGTTSGDAPKMSNSMSSNGGNNSTILPQIENLPSSQMSSLSIKEGMYVQVGQPIFAVYNTTSVWAMLNIYAQDAGLIKVGNQVSISVETNPDEIIHATIDYIEPIVGQNASAIKARVFFKNAENLHLKIGILLSAEISAQAIKGIWIPHTAAVNLGQKSVVFIKTKEYFTAKYVQTGFEINNMLLISGGLNGDENIAVNAQYLVDSESFISSEGK